MSRLASLLFGTLAACTAGTPAGGDSAAPYAAVTVSPDAIDFGYVDLPETKTRSVRVESDGTAPLVVTEVSAVNEAYQVSGPELPVEIPPGERVVLSVAFTPEDVRQHRGSLIVRTDAGEERVELRGHGGPVEPVALCEADTGWDPSVGVEVTLEGANSYDPDGDTIVDYAWTLYERPEGSAATIPEGGPNRALTPDVPGAYAASLVVTDEHGLASPACTVSFEAVAAPGFAVEVRWEIAGDDMDLHLLAPGGELGGDGDCYYQTCVGTGPDWGGAGIADDPLLELDDHVGTGPERARIHAPAPGTYTVYVHDYPDGYSTIAPDAVTVDVYLDGVLAWSETREIEGEEAYVPFAEVTFPTGAITPR